jgi:hypothetical protein
VVDAVGKLGEGVDEPARIIADGDDVLAFAQEGERLRDAR